ncbi:MAG: PD40 domain-containing protein, partial [Deltaproteobacteria bacterium]|nr:PD40 domain-containing protein [Deltaproteobacteria bacterium]
MSPEDTFRKFLITVFAAACLFVWTAGAHAMEAESFSVHLPVPITAEADPVLSFSVSENGTRLAFVSKRKRFSDLWLRSLDPAAFFSMRRLTDDPALESDPAFSRDGRFLAFTSTKTDAKGDIYVVDLKEKAPVPIRITGKETEDGAPCFGPGKTLYFHRKQPELRAHELATVNI